MEIIIFRTGDINEYINTQLGLSWLTWLHIWSQMFKANAINCIVELQLTLVL